MIKTPTTFVIGAGASEGLPAGDLLKRMAARLTHDDHVFQLLLQCYVSSDDLRTTLDELKLDSSPSLDAFLESRHDRADVMRAGRGLIAALLGQAIVGRRRSGTANVSDDWLGYIIARMREGARNSTEFMEGNAQVRFVTFNFDDLIEDRIAREIRGYYPSAGKDFDRLSRQFRVIHVHGELPQPLPPHELRHDNFHGCSKEWVAWALQAIEKIRVVHDDIDPGVIQAVQDAVEAASVICFLGFGYGTANLDRLGFPRTLRIEHPLEVFGSAFGLRPGEQQAVFVRLLKKIQLGRIEHKCLDVLRDFYVLRG